MARDDLQIGDVWTAPHERGNGLAAYALLSICKAEGNRERTYWYIAEETNVASIRLAEKTGFKKVAYGQRKKRGGIAVLGAYRMEEHLPHA